MLPVLKIAAQGEIRISDAVERLGDEFALTADERAALLPSGRQTTFANRVHWAKSYLGKAGLVALTKRAYFQITPRGLGVLAAPPDRIDIRYLEQFPDFAGFRDVGKTSSGPEPVVSESPSAEGVLLTPDEVIRRAHYELEAALAGDLLQRIRSGTPAFFESVTVRLLIAMGYGGSSAPDISAALKGGTGDGGIDGVIDQDPLASTAFTSRQNATPMATLLERAPFVISLAVSTGLRRTKGFLSRHQPSHSRLGKLRSSSANGLF